MSRIHRHTHTNARSVIVSNLILRRLLLLAASGRLVATNDRFKWFVLYHVLAQNDPESN